MDSYRAQELALLERALAGAPLLFIDFEASSLDPKRSYPIQFGWQRVRAGRLADGGTFLIRPAPHWDVPGSWSEAAARVHGLTRDALAGGLDAAGAARRTLELAAGAVVAGDAPSYDRHWWRVLLDELPHKERPPVMLHLDELSTQLVVSVRGIADETVVAAARDRACTLRPPTHRAGDDAAHLARRWIELLHLLRG
jgi:hypothetical protein